MPLGTNDRNPPNAIAEVYQREDRLWDWRVKARNGEIVATSGGQGFTRKEDALSGLFTAIDCMEAVPGSEVRYA